MRYLLILGHHSRVGVFDKAVSTSSTCLYVAFILCFGGTLQ